MKAKFVVSPTIKSADGGVEAIRTDMLLLTKIDGMGLGAGPRAVDQMLGGQISTRMKEREFRGRLGENLLLRLDDDSIPQNHVLVIGLGQASGFDPCALAKVVETAVAKAVARKCTRLSIPVAAHRMTALNLNLRGTAHIIRKVAEAKLAEIEGAGTLEIELVCTSQAKRHIEAGLACRKAVVCCAQK